MKHFGCFFCFVLLLGGCGQDEDGVDQSAVDDAQQEIEWKGELATLVPDDVERFRTEAHELYEMGNYNAARGKMQRAYAAYKRFGDGGKTTRVDYLRFFAELANVLEENDKTIKHATDVAIYAVTDEDKAFAFALKAKAFSNKEQYEKADRYYRASLKIQLKTLGPEHPDVAVTYNNIGMACDFKGAHHEAIDYHQKSLEVDLKRRDLEQLVVAPTYNKIGRNYADCGDKANAIAYFQRAKAIYLKQLGSSHPLTRSAENSLARLNN